MSKRNIVKFILSFIAYYLVISFINYDFFWFKSLLDNYLNITVLIFAFVEGVFVSLLVTTLASNEK